MVEGDPDASEKDAILRSRIFFVFIGEYSDRVGIRPSLRAISFVTDFEFNP